MPLQAKTIGHIHTDPKLIQQTDCRTSLVIGKPVFLDIDGLYKLAYISTDDQTSNIQGLVWGFLGKDKFLLRATPGPMEYRFPLTKTYFDISGVPLNSMIPGSLGDIIWLGTSPGEYSTTKSTFIIGYKTAYGFVYQPKNICCLTDVSCFNHSQAAAHISLPAPYNNVPFAFTTATSWAWLTTMGDTTNIFLKLTNLGTGFFTISLSISCGTSFTKWESTILASSLHCGTNAPGHIAGILHVPLTRSDYGVNIASCSSVIPVPSTITITFT